MRSWAVVLLCPWFYDDHDILTGFHTVCVDALTHSSARRKASAELRRRHVEDMRKTWPDHKTPYDATDFEPVAVIQMPDDCSCSKKAARKKGRTC
jgi:hypothetical protein